MEYAIARLIETMGMFIHDLSELKNGTDQIYTESAYDSVASSIFNHCGGEMKFCVEQLKENCINCDNSKMIDGDYCHALRAYQQGIKECSELFAEIMSKIDICGRSCPIGCEWATEDTCKDTCKKWFVEQLKEDRFR